MKNKKMQTRMMKTRMKMTEIQNQTICVKRQLLKHQSKTIEEDEFQALQAISKLASATKESKSKCELGRASSDWFESY